MHFLAIFLHLCDVIVIPNILVKDHFNRLSCPSLRSVMWMSKFLPEFIAAAARKLQFYFLLDFSKSKTLWHLSFILISKRVHQRVSPGKIWRNLWFQVWKSTLDIYSPLVLMRQNSWFTEWKRQQENNLWLRNLR